MWNSQIKVTEFKLVIIMNLSFNQSAVFINRYLRAIANQNISHRIKVSYVQKWDLQTVFMYFITSKTENKKP